MVSKKQELNKFVKFLHSIMKKENLSEIIWEEEKTFTLKLNRECSKNLHPLQAAPVPAPLVDINKNAYTIKSPMNGIFYRAPSPQDDPFVKENDIVEAGSTICIIEAMKLLNEVQVEPRCKILKILVENSASIKISQPIFEVENL